ncbi:MAG: DUF2996 domain-containing protein [Cyanobacteriota bacterium]|nr:DUF2996 domain-containing protein [Cyanobacteriota bacterium]
MIRKPVPESDPATNVTAAASAAAPAAKAKPPAPEDKPFADFLPQLLVPALAREINSYGGGDCQLAIEQGPMPVVGLACTMLRGTLADQRRFWLCFTSADINSPKTIALAEAGSEPSLLESFLIDEKKMTLALLVSRLVQRLNGQKWLGPN